MNLIDAIQEYRAVHHQPPSIRDLAERTGHSENAVSLLVRGVYPGQVVEWRCERCGCVKPCCRPHE